MNTILILIVILRTLLPDFSTVVRFQNPKEISLLNPISEEVIGVAQFNHSRRLRGILLNNEYYEVEENKAIEMSEFLPDIMITYDKKTPFDREMKVYVDFIFRTVLFQLGTGDYQYLQLTEEGNLKLLEYITVSVFPSDNFLKTIYLGNKSVYEHRLWE
jgi:hypothetical protein